MSKSPKSSEQEKPVLIVNNLRPVLPKMHFRPINLSLRRNECLAVVGESGSGKSTLLRCLAGLSPVAEGKVLLFGQNISKRPPHQRQIGLIFQDNALLPHMRLLKQLCFFSGKPISEIREALHETGLKEKEHAYPHELSGGEQKRAAMLRVLLSGSKLLLADEPFTGTDPGLRNGLRTYFLKMRKKYQIPTVLVSHSHEDISRLADRVLIMRSGAKEQDGTLRELYENPKNAYCARFTGDFLKLPDPNTFLRREDFSVSIERVSDSDIAFPIIRKNGKIFIYNEENNFFELHINSDLLPSGAQNVFVRATRKRYFSDT